MLREEEWMAEEERRLQEQSAGQRDDIPGRNVIDGYDGYMGQQSCPGCGAGSRTTSSVARLFAADHQTVNIWCTHSSDKRRSR